MYKLARSIVQKIGAAVGLDIRRRTIWSSREVWLRQLCATHGITSILDVGANRGQFANEMLYAGWTGRIKSFEPLSAAHKSLVTNAQKFPNWTVAPRCALGASNGQTEINIAGNSESSSLLPMLARHIQAAPTSVYVGKETVDVVTLDGFLSEAGSTSSERYLLKMDVQGFEKQVLQGAERVLAHSPIIYTEMSLQPLYAGESGFLELSADIIARGYKCVAITPAYGDDAEMLQVDGTFVRLR